MSSKSTLKLKGRSAWQSTDRATRTGIFCNHKLLEQQHALLCVCVCAHVSTAELYCLETRISLPALCVKLSCIFQVFAVMKLFSYVLHNLLLSVLKCPFALTLHDFLPWVWCFCSVCKQLVFSLMHCTLSSPPPQFGTPITTGSY